MAFFKSRLVNTPTNVMKVSLTHRKVVWKTFGPIFSSVKCFGKSVEIILFYNVQSMRQSMRQSPRYMFCRKVFFLKITSNFQKKTGVGFSFLVKLKAAVFLWYTCEQLNLNIW